MDAKVFERGVTRQVYSFPIWCLYCCLSIKQMAGQGRASLGTQKKVWEGQGSCIGFII